MQDASDALWLAVSLVARLDADLLEIVGLSLHVSLSALAFACLIGLPLGALLAVNRFRGRSTVLIAINALMGLPPVVVGLIVYLHLSRAGPLGWMALLYTPTAMIIAQTVLVAPIIAALTRQTIEDARSEYDEQLRALGVRPARYSVRKCSNTLSQYSAAKFAPCSGMPIRSATACASARSSFAVQYSVPSSSSQFFMNRPSTAYPCCFSNSAATEESTPPDMPTMTFCPSTGLTGGK